MKKTSDGGPNNREYDATKTAIETEFAFYNTINVGKRFKIFQLKHFSECLLMIKNKN